MLDRSFPVDAFPAIVAHRGASSTHPENTIPSFAAAIELGASIVELDVRLSADGTPVVMHDPSVDRTTDGTGLVHELSAQRIAGLSAGTSEVPAGVPSLAEVLELARGRAAVALEIKNVPGEPNHSTDEAIVRAVHEELERSAFPGPVLVISFNPSSIAASRAGAPGVPTGLLTTEHVDPREALAHVISAGHPFLLPGTRALIPAGAGFIDEAHAAGVRIGTWTVDDREGMRMLLDRGVDAVASNDPAMALAVLAERS